MSEIWNLSALCRCCHTDGHFKSLQAPYNHDGNVEIYSVVLRNTFGINIQPPPFEASYTICDDCIIHLRDAARFKQQVVLCEKKFDEYCKNEQALTTQADFVKIKEEFPDNGVSISNNDSDIDDKYEDDSIDDKNYVKLDKGQKNIEFKYIGTDDPAVQIKREASAVKMPRGRGTIKRGGGRRGGRGAGRVSKPRCSRSLSLPIPNSLMGQLKALKMAKALDAKNLAKLSHLAELRKKKQVGNFRMPDAPETKKGKGKATDREEDTQVWVSCQLLPGVPTAPQQWELQRSHASTTSTTAPGSGRSAYELDDYPSQQIEISIENIKETSERTAHKKRRAKKKSIGSPKRILKKTTDPTLEVHVKTESGEIYSCKICGGSYNLLKKLRLHIYQNHLCQTFKCEYCPKKYNNENLFKKHINTHGNEKRFKCNYCVKNFSTKQGLMDHHNSHTKERVFKCDLCQKEFSYKSSLIKHIKWHNGTNKKCICDTCGHSFNDMTNLRKHIMAVHEKLRPFCCEICPKTFSAKKHLVTHIRIHNGEKPYKCDMCTQAFASYNYVKKHKLTVHGDREGMTYTCVVCKKTFLDRGRFRIHVRSHSGSLPHKCPLCSKDFSCKYSMKRHVNEHYGLKPHTCDICQKSFTQKTQLNRHLKNLHNPDKVKGEKVKCDMCKINVYDLEKHKQSHFNRPHKCDLCEKSYSERNALNRHINSIHLGRKRHECKVCGKKYTNIGSLRNHKVKIHKLVLKKEMEDNLDNVLTAFTIPNGNGQVDEN